MYQAKAILRSFGVLVPEGHVVYNGNSARDWIKCLGDALMLSKPRSMLVDAARAAALRPPKLPMKLKSMPATCSA